MKKYLLLTLSILTFSITYSQDLTVDFDISDESDELNTAVVTINVKDGTAPYQYFWSEKSVTTSTSKLTGATEGKEYTVKVVDAAKREGIVVIDVPTNSIPEKMSAVFAPVVGFMDTYFFFDPFHGLGLYDNRVKDDNGNVLLNCAREI